MRRPQQPARAIFSPSDQRDYQRQKNRTLEGSAIDDIACADGADGTCRPSVGVYSYFSLIQSARGENKNTKP